MIEAIFDRERETKNTVRFEERVGDDPPIIGTLYIQKWALRRLGEPSNLRVRIDAGQSEPATSEE